MNNHMEEIDFDGFMQKLKTGKNQNKKINKIVLKNGSETVGELGGIDTGFVVTRQKVSLLDHPALREVVDVDSSAFAFTCGGFGRSVEILSLFVDFQKNSKQIISGIISDLKSANEKGELSEEDKERIKEIMENL